MEAKERMTQLLLQVSEEDEDALITEWMDLEPVLSIQELLLLLGAADRGSVDMYEPMAGVMMHARRLDPESIPSILTAAWMGEGSLLCLARQARLLRLGLLEMAEMADGCWVLVLTPRGAHAANWWLGALEDLGLTHDELNSDENWPDREGVSEAAPPFPPPSTSP